MHVIRNHAEADKLNSLQFDDAPKGTFLEIWNDVFMQYNKKPYVSAEANRTADNSS